MKDFKSSLWINFNIAMYIFYNYKKLYIDRGIRLLTTYEKKKKYVKISGI